jgi:hypothetical protein
MNLYKKIFKNFIMIELLKITLMPFITVKKTIIHAINKANTNCQTIWPKSLIDPEASNTFLL